MAETGGAQAGGFSNLGDIGGLIGRAHQNALGGVEDRLVALLLVFGLNRALAVCKSVPLLTMKIHSN